MVVDLFDEDGAPHSNGRSTSPMGTTYLAFMVADLFGAVEVAIDMVR
jgi:hypothetical protein